MSRAYFRIIRAFFQNKLNSYIGIPTPSAKFQKCVCVCVYARSGDWPESIIEAYTKVIMKNKKTIRKLKKQYLNHIIFKPEFKINPWTISYVD